MNATFGADSAKSFEAARTIVALLDLLDEPERGRRCVELLDRAVAIGRRFLAPGHPARREMERALAGCPAAS